jgi:hypothetical protein
MNETYIKMCKESHGIRSFWKPKPGDTVSVVWQDPVIGGIEEPIELNDNPVYGLHYDNNTWYLNNGMIGKTHLSGLLYSHDPGATVIWYPSLTQLIDISDRCGLDPLDVVIDCEGETIGVYILKLIMFWQFDKLWDKYAEKWVYLKW